MTHGPKKPKIRLRKGSPAYIALQEAVWLRDRNRCYCCGTWNKAPPHHDPHVGQGGQDRMEDMHTVCFHCHTLIHDKYGSMEKTKEAMQKKV